MATHKSSGRGNADQGAGKHSAGELTPEERSMPAKERAQLAREGGYDVGGRSTTRDAQRHSDKGQSHQRD